MDDYSERYYEDKYGELSHECSEQAKQLLYDLERARDETDYYKDELKRCNGKNKEKDEIIKHFRRQYPELKRFVIDEKYIDHYRQFPGGFYKIHRWQFYRNK